MKFSTTVKISKSKIHLSHQKPITLVGSCFAESIGNKLIEGGFNVNQNPFGIIYNPISICNAIDRVIDEQFYDESELLNSNGKWMSLDHHGKFSSSNVDVCLEQINSEISGAHECLKNSQVLVITLGSAWVYNYEKGKIVANCHKLPSSSFNKTLLQFHEVVISFEQVMEKLKKFNPELNIVFTVSPVRYTRDGLHENNVSKGVLHLAVHSLINKFDNCTYFPAYELVNDELRDYRFFNDDLVHPSNMAVNYVWQKFGETFFSEETFKLSKEVSKINLSKNHRALDEDSKEYQAFKDSLEERILAIKNRYPEINL